MRELVTTEEVEAWLANYTSPQKALLSAVRGVILDADPRIGEAVKWSTPTFVYKGNLASFNPRSKAHVSLLFHTGASIPGDFPSLEGGEAVARYIKIASFEDLAAKRDELAAIVASWCDQRDGIVKPKPEEPANDGGSDMAEQPQEVMYFTEENSAETVIARLKDASDPRFKQVMAAAVRHLHAFVKEVQPTPEEWMAAIQWLTSVGQWSNDKRQEWILTSDTLGVSMLVETINNRALKSTTEATVLGPFYVAGSPELPMGADIRLDGKGDRCLVSGRVTDQHGNPLANAVLDVWQTNSEGFYAVQQPGEQEEMNLRGRFRTGPDGRYWFWTTRPVSYPIPTDGPVGQMLRASARSSMRPAHVHFIVSAPGCETLVTHIFVKGDRYLASDPVFGVKEQLVVPFERDGDHWKADFDFALKDAG